MSLLDEEPEDNANITMACAKLAELLRKSGSRILTNSAALSLTWPVIHRISTALSLVSSRTSETEQALDEKLLLDLEYLKSFLHRVPSLHLHHTVESDLTGWIQLDGLQYLRHLDLKRLPIHLVRGFASIRPQITSLQVSRCTFTIEELLSDCCGDEADPGEWTNLARLGMQSNCLKQLGHALQLAPNLQVLDCSHNAVTDTAGLYELPALTSVNLSYNLLTTVPDFQPRCSHTLTVLALAYNHLETLAGLETLISLVHLDVSSNCLMHHDVLSPLSSLPKLQVLRTVGNPLSTHPRHRLKCSAWLHSALLTTQPVLDDVQLSRAELAMVGTNRVIVTPPVSPIADNDLDLPLPKSASRAGSVEGSLVSGYTSTTGGARRKRGKSSKRRRVREAVIADPTDHDLETTATEGDTSEVPDTGDETQPEHLTTATKLQMLRETFGEEDWMRAQAGDQLNQLLGLEVKPGPDTSTIIADLMSRDIAKSGSVTSYNHDESSTQVLQSTPIKESTSSASPSKESPVSITRQSPLDRSSSHEVEGDVSKRLSEMSNSFYSVYKRCSNTSNSGAMDRSTEANAMDEGGSRISVDRVIPGDDSGAPGEKLHLFVTSEFIREQTEEGTTRVKWFLHSLEACDMLSTEGGLVTAHLLFNTVRRDRRDRTYTMSEANYSILMSVVGPILEAAATAAASLPALQCVKCQSMFSHDVEGRSRKAELRCPNCGSTMVIEADNNIGEKGDECQVAVGIPVCEALDLETIAGAERTSCTPEPEVSRGSQPENTYLGVDAGNALNTSISPVPGTMAGHAVQVTADIHDHVVNSADTHLPDLLPRPEPSNCGDNSHVRQMSSSPSGTLQRSESSSDISVLSNPSESSIEVLPMVRSQMTPERPNVTTEAVTPVTEAKQAMVESSSSGSLVNSVVLNLSSQEGEGVAEQVDTDEVVKEERSEEERRSDEGDKSRDDLTSVEDESLSSVYLSCDDTGATTVTGSTLDDTQGSTFLETDDETNESNTLHTDNADTVLDTTLSDCDVTNEETGDSALATPVDKGSKFLAESPSRFTFKVEPLTEDSTSNNLAFMKSVMSWNYENFSIADHRVQLFCELSIFKEPEEDLLIIAKGAIHIKSTAGMFTGVLLVSNRRIYILKVTKSETEEPSDWLSLVSSCPVSRLERLVYLLGGQGVGLELAGVEAKPATPSFLSRGVAGYVAGEGADCYYVVVRDEDRTDRLVDQLVDRLQEMVRGTPIPVTRLTKDEEVLLEEQLGKQEVEQLDGDVVLFLLVNRIDTVDGGARSMIVTRSHVFLSSDFFEWIFKTSHNDLSFQNCFPITEITQMSIYQSWPERVCLELGPDKIELRLETERGVQRLVKALRGPWEERHGKALEECISFHPTGSGRVLRMQTMLMEDSITFADFDLSQWIKVTSDKSAKAAK